MKAEVRWVHEHHFIGADNKGNQTHFDSRDDDSFPSGVSPIYAVLEALAACSAMDVVDIIRKKRKTVSDLKITASAERAMEHPKVYTKSHLHFALTSPDAELSDLNRAIELSHDKYCSLSALFKNAGCDSTWSSEIIR
jgi:putative redox protein